MKRDNNALKQIPIDEIHFDDDRYFREDIDLEQVGIYRESVPDVDPITVSQENVLIDGRHRVQAFIQEEIDVIAGHVLHVEDERDRYRASIRLNDDTIDVHRKKVLARELSEYLSIPDIADTLGVGTWAVEVWVDNDSNRSEDEPLLTVSNGLKALKNPEKLTSLTYWKLHSFCENVNEFYYDIINDGDYNDSGVDIFARDWDNLIVLDACRYDYFAVRSDIDGILERAYSKASMTKEWVEANFTGRDIHDLVYVSANGHYFNLRDKIDSEIFKYVPLWEDKYRSGPQTMVTPPETVTEHAVEMAEAYPQKRLLVHYIQPHHPFIGPSAEKLDHGRGIYDTANRNDLDRDALVELYIENLDIVLDHVRDLLPRLQGKTVITADHGEMFGERAFPIPIRTFEHPRGIYTRELVEIPWLEIENGPRKEIAADSPVENEGPDSSEVVSHLEDLGYVM